MRRRALKRGGMFLAGLILARFIPSRRLRRVLLLTVVPAAVGFVLDRVRFHDASSP
jgi:hypothetical protein